MEVQTGWKWCKKCHGLFADIPGDPRQGVCPVDSGHHDGSTSLPYTAVLGDGGPGQQGSWRFCRKCRGMFAFQDGALQGVCPADHASHDGSTSLHYASLIGEDAYGQQGGWRWCRNCQGMFAMAGEDDGTCPATASQQSGWRWCRKCQGMFSADNPSQGSCPAGGAHDGSTSLHYATMIGEATPGRQGGWRWCRKCQGLFSSDNPSQGVCPAGNAHDGGTSQHYTLGFGQGGQGQQSGWRWCRKCQGLFSSDNPSQGVCPAGGADDAGTSLSYVAVMGDAHPGHDGTTSLHYSMLQSVVAEFSPSQLPIVAGEVQCDRAQVQFASNGDWTFSGHLHDFSTFTGDNYAFGFVFNFTDGGAHGPAVTGQLGSSLTSLPESKTFGVSGNDPWVALNWQKAFPNGGISACTPPTTSPRP